MGASVVSPSQLVGGRRRSRFGALVALLSLLASSVVVGALAAPPAEAQPDRDGAYCPTHFPNTRQDANYCYRVVTPPCTQPGSEPDPVDPNLCRVPVPLAACPYTGYTDVVTETFYALAVEWAACSGVSTGTSDTTFSAAASMTRAQWATFLWRLEGEPTGFSHPFVDVPSGQFYTEAVAWMNSTSVTNGTSATTFSPNQTMSRAQLATFLWRYHGEPTGYSHPFVDVPSGQYYTEAVAWMSSLGLTAGTSPTTFSPDDEFIRSEAVTFLWRYSNIFG